jgi:predicted hotdog family 3-hydroxylacyl-ACP dehydratase
MMLDKTALCALIPHAGVMCLLDGVEHWDTDAIHCVSRSHRDPHHPLRCDGRLAGVHLLEYGAQAMALHGALLAQVAGRALAPGLLAALREVVLAVESIEAIEATLQVRAWRLGQLGSSLLYRFEVAAAERILATARASVVESAETPP